MSPQHRIPMSTENYLEAIHLLERDRGYVRSTDLAKYLGISRASVSKALNQLVDAGYVKHEHYGDVIMTETGHRLAQDIFLRHKILYIFLSKCLNIDEKIADEEACLIEHAISSTTKTALISYLEDKFGKDEFLKMLNSDEFSNKH